MNGKNKKKQKIGCSRKTLSDEIDEELYKFFEIEREVGRIVSDKLLIVEDKKIGMKHGFPDFEATTQYIENFIKRYSISMRIRMTDYQKMSKELKDEVTCFLNCVKEL